MLAGELYCPLLDAGLMTRLNSGDTSVLAGLLGARHRVPANTVVAGNPARVLRNKG